MSSLKFKTNWSVPLWCIYIYIFLAWIGYHVEWEMQPKIGITWKLDWNTLEHSISNFFNNYFIDASVTLLKMSPLHFQHNGMATSFPFEYVTFKYKNKRALSNISHIECHHSRFKAATAYEWTHLSIQITHRRLSPLISKSKALLMSLKSTSCVTNSSNFSSCK